MRVGQRRRRRARSDATVASHLIEREAYNSCRGHGGLPVECVERVVLYGLCALGGDAVLNEQRAQARERKAGAHGSDRAAGQLRRSDADEREPNVPELSRLGGTRNVVLASQDIDEPKNWGGVVYGVTAAVATGCDGGAEARRDLSSPL